MEDASLYFTTVLSKAHRRTLKTDFEQMEAEQEARRTAHEARADEVMDPDWEGGGVFRG